VGSTPFRLAAPLRVFLVLGGLCWPMLAGGAPQGAFTIANTFDVDATGQVARSEGTIALSPDGRRLLYMSDGLRSFDLMTGADELIVDWQTLRQAGLDAGGGRLFTGVGVESPMDEIFPPLLDGFYTIESLYRVFQHGNRVVAVRRMMSIKPTVPNGNNVAKRAQIVVLRLTSP
jgi:hypothetical protein